MAFDTYSNLQTAIATRLNRAGDTNLTALIPDAISLFEADMQRRLRTREMEVRYTASTVAGTAYLALPDSFGGFRRLELTSTVPTRLLKFVTPSEMAELWRLGKQDTPIHYTIMGTELKFGPIPDSAYTLEADYYRTFTALSNSNTSNWILTSHPDAYLYGSLIHLPEEFLNAQLIPLWQQRAETAIQRIKDQDLRDRWSGVPLQSRSDVTTQ